MLNPHEKARLAELRKISAEDLTQAEKDEIKQLEKKEAE